MRQEDCSLFQQQSCSLLLCVNLKFSHRRHSSGIWTLGLLCPVPSVNLSLPLPSCPLPQIDTAWILHQPGLLSLCKVPPQTASSRLGLLPLVSTGLFIHLVYVCLPQTVRPSEQSQVPFGLCFFRRQGQSKFSSRLHAGDRGGIDF